MAREEWFIKRIKNVVKDDMYNRLCAWPKLIFQDALASRGYSGFTGNTQTSYTAGIFVDGKLANIQNPATTNLESRRPIRKKVPYRHSVFLSHPFEGDPRVQPGEVHVDNLYGAETARKNVEEFTTNEGFAIFVTTGTEYSEYLEQAHDRLVLYGAMIFTEAQLEAIMEQIPKL